MGMLNHHCGSSNPARKIGSRIMKQSSWAWNGGDATQDVDACMDRWNDLVSDHGYQYSIGIGDAWSVKTRNYDTYPSFWKGGNTYNYGIGEANYLVPAILTHTVIEADYVFQSWQVAIADDGIIPLFTGKYHGKEGNYSGEPNYPVPAIIKHPHIDASRFMYWVFHGWLQAQGYKTRP